MTLRNTLLLTTIGVGLAIGGAAAAQEADPEAAAAEEVENDVIGPDAETEAEAEAEAELAPEAEAEPTPEAEAEAEPAPEVEPELLPGAPLPEPEVFEVVRDTFGDWEVRCAPDETDCFIYQLALDDEENPVAEVSILTLPAGSQAVAGATVVSPLGTLLPAGIVMQVDSGEPRQYEFTFCSQVGCFARFGLTNESVNIMKRGRVAMLQLVSIAAPEEPIVLELSLAGFTAAYDSLEVPPQQ